MRPDRKTLGVLLALLAAGTILRLAVLVSLDPLTWLDGSDAVYYLRQGWRIAQGEAPVLGPVAPAYTTVVALGWMWNVDAPAPAGVDGMPPPLLAGLRVLQILLSTGMVAAATALAARWSGSWRAAGVSCAGLALGPVFVVEPFRILTETLTLALLTAGMWAWARGGGRSRMRDVVAAALLGLAALTRPVVAGLALLVAGRQILEWRRDRDRGERAIVLVVMLAVLLVPWSFSLRAHSGRWTPPGLASTLWIGAAGDGTWRGAEATDELRDEFAGGPDDYLGETFDIVRRDPGRWLAVRLRNLGASLLRPHLVADVPGPSTRTGLRRWWRQDRGAAAFGELVATPAHLSKLALYAAHWLGLAMGAVGLVRWRRHRRRLGVLWIWVLYFPLVHLVLTATPRYLLPIGPALWIAAALAVVAPPPTELAGDDL